MQSLRLTLALPLWALLVAACGDEGSSQWEISVTSNTRAIAADGSTSASLVVFVLDQNGDPAPAASNVIITCVDGAQQPAGVIGGVDVGVSIQQIDTLGQVSTTLACNGDPATETTLICIVRYEGENQVAPPFTCRP